MLTKLEKAKIKELVGTMSFSDMLAEVFTPQFTYEHIEDAYKFCKTLGAFDFISDKAIQNEVLDIASRIAKELGVETYELNPNIVAKEMEHPIGDYNIYSIIINNTKKKRVGCFSQNERRCLTLAFPFVKKASIVNIFYPRNANNIYRTAYRLGLYRETIGTASQCMKVKDLRDYIKDLNDEDTLRFEILGIGGRYVIHNISKRKESGTENRTVYIGLMDEKIYKKNFKSR